MGLGLDLRLGVRRGSPRDMGEPGGVGRSCEQYSMGRPYPIGGGAYVVPYAVGTLKTHPLRPLLTPPLPCLPRRARQARRLPAH